MREIEVCPLDELPAGTVRIVPSKASSRSASTTATASSTRLEDRCSHDDGPLCEGEFDCEDKVAACPRHGARFDITTGRPLSLPAYLRSRPIRYAFARTG